jgi:hypothetical protein
MKYNFTTLIKHESSENHLEINGEIDQIHKGIYDSNNLQHSSLPQQMRQVGNEKLNKIKKGDRILVTKNTIETFILQRD